MTRHRTLANPSPWSGWFASWLIVSPEIGLLAVLALFCTGFGLGSRGFLSPFNLFALSRIAAVNGTVLGAVLLAVLGNGLPHQHVGAFWVQFFLGLLRRARWK